jgi:chromosome segregation ATPase
MKNLNRSQNQALPAQVHHHNWAKQAEELASRRQQVDQLWNDLVQADEELAKQKKAVEQTTSQLKKQRHKNENLLQRLMSAIQSRNSMRGRLGNMTMQRNRALKQVERLTEQYRTATQELKTTTEKLGEAYQQVHKVEAEYDQDMTDIAHAYQLVSLAQRAQLPEQFRQILDQIEQDYTGVGE